MYPILVDLGGFQLRTYGVIVALLLFSIAGYFVLRSRALDASLAATSGKQAAPQSGRGGKGGHGGRRKLTRK